MIKCLVDPIEVLERSEVGEEAAFLMKEEGWKDAQTEYIRLSEHDTVSN